MRLPMNAASHQAFLWLNTGLSATFLGYTRIWPQTPNLSCLRRSTTAKHAIGICYNRPHRPVLDNIGQPTGAPILCKSEVMQDSKFDGWDYMAF